MCKTWGTCGITKLELSSPLQTCPTVRSALRHLHLPPEQKVAWKMRQRAVGVIKKTALAWLRAPGVMEGDFCFPIFLIILRVNSKWEKDMKDEFKKH